MTESSIEAVRAELSDSQATATALKEKVEAGRLTEAEVEAALQTAYELKAQADRLDRALSELEAKAAGA
jgi:hypothetical protein